MALDDAGRVVATVNLNQGYHVWGVVRYLPDGRVDRPLATVEQLHSSDLVRQPDGRYVVPGTVWSSGSGEDLAAWRMTVDLALDATFGDDGLAVAPIAETWDVGVAAAFQADGKVVVAGVSGDGVGVGRFLASGPHGVRSPRGGTFLETGPTALPLAYCRRGVTTRSSGVPMATNG